MTGTILGPVAPTVGARAVVRPLGLDETSLLASGSLGAWQRVVSARTIPHCLERLEASHTVDNLRRAVGEHTGPFVGMWFADSDVYKTLEAMAWDQARGEDRRVLVEELTALLARVQRPDGYLNSWYQVDKPEAIFSELQDGHELYCLGHLIQAAVAWYRATGEDGLLTIARRFADLVVDRFGPDTVAGFCGHPEIESALVELMRCTGERAYLELAVLMIDRRGSSTFGTSHFGSRYYQDHEPVRVASEATGHAVRQIYLATGVVDAYLETGDDELLAAAVRIWDSAHDQKAYVTGGFGSRHRDESFGDAYELPAERAYAETCAAIADVMWSWRLLLATGEGRYADAIEHALHNAVAVGASITGDAFFYSNPLQVRTGHAEDSDWSSFAHRAPWFECACCPPNLARLVAGLQHYVATTDSSGVQLHQYTDADIAVGSETLAMRTRYPWDGRIEVRAPAALGGRSLRLRVPGWAENWTLTVDGAPSEPPVSNGYVTIVVPSAGCTVVLDLDLLVRILVPHSRVDAVRGCVAVARGPVVFAAEETDLPASVVLEDVRLDTATAIELSEPVAGLDDVPLTLRASGVVVDPGPASAVRARTAATDAAVRNIRLTLVPYARWGNRDQGAMRVWIPENLVRPTHPSPHQEPRA